MTRVQIVILAVLAMFVCIVFGIAAVVVRAQLLTPPDSGMAQQPREEELSTPGPTPTWTIMPTNTHTPTPVETLTPTPTNTRVVLDTPTPTPSLTPTVTPTPTQTGTPTPARGGGGGGGSPSRGPSPTPAPTSRFPLKILGEPLTYETKNYIFVVYARITSGNTLLPGYRMVGTHYPTGAHVESPPSCGKLCKGSGPKRENWLIQESNLAFEAFFYDTGTWSLVLLDPQGQQASEALEIKIDIKDRKWFYYHFSR